MHSCARSILILYCHNSLALTTSTVPLAGMFKLPQNLSAPFGLLGDEAKLTFRSQPGGIAKLASNRVRGIW